MNNLPLLDVKAVDDRYNYMMAYIGAKEVPRYYACAQDGWMCVNAFFPNGTATPYYLWVDARPKNGEWAPYWEAGTYSPTEIWHCGCGQGGDWVPGPPVTAVPSDGGGGDEGGEESGSDDEIGSSDDEAGPSTSDSAGSSGDGDGDGDGGDEIGDGDGDADDGSLGDDGDYLGPCTSSRSTTAECTYPDPDPDCPHPEQICGFVGANIATETPTCVCLTDDDACFPPDTPYECEADDDCDAFGNAFCYVDTVTLEGTCVCAPETP